MRIKFVVGLDETAVHSIKSTDMSNRDRSGLHALLDAQKPLPCSEDSLSNQDGR